MVLKNVIIQYRFFKSGRDRFYDFNNGVRICAKLMRVILATTFVNIEKRRNEKYYGIIYHEQ